MTLKILEGDAKTNFLDVIVDQIRKIPQTEDIFLIVPNNLKFKTEIEVLNRLRQSTSIGDEHFFSLPNLKIYSFNRLVWYFLNDSTYFQLPELTISLKNMILTAVLQENNEQLAVYHNFASDTGFVDLLRQQIETFQNENLTPQELASVDIPELDEAKKADLVLIYQLYEAAIAQPFREEQGDFIKLGEYLKQVDLSQTNFIFFDYLQFTKVEFDLFTQFLRQAKNVYYLRYHDQVFHDQSLIDNLESLAIKPQILHCAKQKDNQIAAIFLNQSATTSSSKPDVTIFRMKNRYDEVKKIALEVSHLIRDQQVRYSDILIVGSDLDQYQVIFKEVFDHYQIPFFGQFTNSMENSTITYLLKKVLALVNRQIQLNDLFDLLKTRLLFKEADLSPNAIADAENFALLLGISGYDFLYLDLNENRLKSTFNQQIEQLANFLTVRQLLRDLLLPLISHLKRGKTARDYATTIYNFCEQSEIFNNLNLRKAAAYQSKQQLTGDRINQEVNNFGKLLDEIVTVFEDKELSLTDFTQILINGFKTKTYQLVPAVIDAVQISPINQVNLPSYQYVWIINATDDQFPRNHDRNELLLASEEIEAIAQATNNNFLLRYVMRYQNQMESGLDYLIMSLAQKKLYLSFPSQVDDNKLLPSPYVTELHAQLQIPIQDFQDQPTNDDFLNRLLLPTTSLSDLVQILREAFISNVPLSTEWSTLFDWFKEERPDELRLVLRALNLKPKHEVNPEVIEGIFKQNLFLSITNMETYFRNPYEFFVKYVLKVKERSVSEINAVVSGLIFHQTLDFFFKQLRKEQKSLDNLSDVELQEISHQVYQQTVKAQNLEFLMSDPINHFNLAIIEQTILKTLQSFKSQGLRSRTLFTEKSFGNLGDEIQPIFDLGFGRQLRINGKIDRLDLFQTPDQEFFNVIDYKSSNRKFNLNDFYSGLDIQLITYLQILKDYYFTAPKQHVGGSFFYQVQDPQVAFENVQKDPQHAWLKSFQYNGLYLNDPKYLTLITQDLSKNGFKWTDFFPRDRSRTTKNAYRSDEFQLIFAYNKRRFKKLAELIYAGKFPQRVLFRTFPDILNYRNDPYQAILLFDPEFDRRFQVLKPKTPEELLKLMRDELNGQN